MSEIETILNHKYKNIDLLNTALTHSSYANDNNVESYERMEFLGDTLLQTIVSIEIMGYHHLSEGELSKLRAKIVSAKFLEHVCDNLNITRFIKVGKSIKIIPLNIKADVIESIIASLYLDSGFEVAHNFVSDNILVSVDKIDEIYNQITDFKSMLQEKLGSKAVDLKYNLVSRLGVEHCPTFKVELRLNDDVISICNGESLKQAEQNCAKEALEKIK